MNISDTPILILLINHNDPLSSFHTYSRFVITRRNTRPSMNTYILISFPWSSLVTFHFRSRKVAFHAQAMEACILISECHPIYHNRIPNCGTIIKSLSLSLNVTAQSSINRNLPLTSNTVSAVNSSRIVMRIDLDSISRCLSHDD